MSGPEARDNHGYDAAVVLTVLTNYRKYEAANPYVIKLSVLDDEIALNVSPAMTCIQSGNQLTSYCSGISLASNLPINSYEATEVVHALHAF